MTSFDRDRALLRLLDSVPELGATDAGQERVSPDLDRKKRVISRDSLMKQAEQVFIIFLFAYTNFERFLMIPLCDFLRQVMNPSR